MSAWLYYFLRIHKCLVFHNGWWSRLLHWAGSLLLCYGWWLGISIPGIISLPVISLTVLVLPKQQGIVWEDWLLRGIWLQLWKCDLQLLFLVHHLSSLCSTPVAVLPSKGTLSTIDSFLLSSLPSLLPFFVFCFSANISKALKNFFQWFEHISEHIPILKKHVDDFIKHNFCIKFLNYFLFL